jgi:glycosyltransferase involved in cell wall biosynthesis
MNTLTAGALGAARSRAPAIRGGTPRWRIGLLIPSLESGGAERACALLANELTARGHQVVLMTFSHPDTDTFALAPTVQRVVIGGARATPGLGDKLRKNLQRWRRVRWQLRHARLNVALSFMNVSNVCLALAGRGTGTVCIGAERSYPGAEVTSVVDKWVRWATYGCLDAVVAQTEDSAAWLRKHTRARKVAVIANPVILPLPAGTPMVDPSRCVRPDARLLLAVGRLDEVKCFDRLLRAFAQAVAAQASSPWQLAILGDGPLRAPLQAQVQQLGLQQRVLMPLRVGNVGDWLARADAFALTSRYEGYPNALLEALASGVPAVACDVLAGPRELIQDGVNGLLVPANSHAALTAALGRMMGDAPMRQRMASQAQLTLDKHSPELALARWEAVFAQAIADRRQVG